MKTMRNMRQGNTLILAVPPVIVLILIGCASVQQQPYRNSFLPPARPSTESANIVLDPPSAESHNVYLAGTTALINPPLQVPPRPSDADLRIRRAEQHYDDGRKAFQEGNLDVARQEFDRAVDILMSAPEKTADRTRLDRKLDEIVDAVYRFDVDGMGAGETGDQVVYEPSPLPGMLEMTFPVDPRLKPKVSGELAATRSQLPLEERDSVLSYIHFFSTDRGRKIMEADLRRAGRYRPLIEGILAKEGLPLEFLYLAQAESGFMPRAVSNKQATGMWQFVAFRAHEYGLEQTAYSDDRLDPEKSTRAAARHLRDLYAHFGDWYLAMAAYNCGPGCVDAAVQRTGYADFWTLANMHVLPEQTAHYVPLILAMTIMAKNPGDYGLNVDPEPPLEYDTVRMSALTSQNLLADACQCPVSEIRDLNPALLKGMAPAGYEIHVPKGTSQDVLAALGNVPESHRNAWRLHRAEAGDTVALLARRYNTQAALISAHNKLSGPLEAGSMVVIPSAYIPVPATVHRTSRTATRVAAAHRTQARKTPVTAKRIVSKPQRSTARTPLKSASLRQSGL